MRDVCLCGRVGLCGVGVWVWFGGVCGGFGSVVLVGWVGVWFVDCLGWLVVLFLVLCGCSCCVIWFKEWFRERGK